jgi:hypothetical protein
LDLGGRAIDFVGQQNVCEDRSERGREFTGSLIEDARADDVARQEIGRELDALERSAYGGGERTTRERLGESGWPFQDDVAARDRRVEQRFDRRTLTDDRCRKCVE